jgi:hypothetical protein
LLVAVLDRGIALSPVPYYPDVERLGCAC